MREPMRKKCSRAGTAVARGCRSVRVFRRGHRSSAWQESGTRYLRGCTARACTSGRVTIRYGGRPALWLRWRLLRREGRCWPGTIPVVSSAAMTPAGHGEKARFPSPKVSATHRYGNSDPAPIWRWPASPHESITLKIAGAPGQQEARVFRRAVRGFRSWLAKASYWQAQCSRARSRTRPETDYYG
jgi:hypothetical protein